MGNRSYLYLEHAKTCLFESNNTLPFFWISILDRDILENYKPAWKHYDKLLSGEEEELNKFYDSEPFPLNIRIEKSRFQKNAGRTQHFIEIGRASCRERV